MIYFEIEFEDGYSMACKGNRIPNVDEAATFYATDVEKFGVIVSVMEIDFDEVKRFFDTDNIDNWPIFE